MRQREPLIVPSHCLDQILLLVRGVCNVIKAQVEEREGGDGDDEMDLVHWDFLHVTSYRDIQKEQQEKSPGYPG